MTTKDEIRGWLKNARADGATHMMVVCDTFEYDDYPVQVHPTENVKDKYAEYNAKSMQKVMEVYDVRLDLETQLAEKRSFHF